MPHTNETSIDLNWHPLSDEDIRHFDDTGYLIVRNVLDSDTIDQLIEVGDRLMASTRRENRQHNSNNLCQSNNVLFNNLFRVKVTCLRD